MLLIGPVVLKMASTGYRFIRYYAGNAAYRRKGPPELILRLIGPIVVLTTVGVFVTGIVLLFRRSAASRPVAAAAQGELHRVGGVHEPARARPSAGRRASAGIGAGASRADRRPRGAAGRWIALSGALVAGAVLAIVLIPDFSAWTAHGVFVHHHHHGG